jgi:hypothetical protein
MAEVTRLVTFVEIDDRDARGLSVSALHQLSLTTGGGSFYWVTEGGPAAGARLLLPWWR